MEKRKKTKELSEDLRIKIVRKHEQSQGYKSISQDLNFPVSTVRSVIKKFKAHGTVADLPRCGRKRIFDERFQRKIVRMVDKEPRLTSKQVQVALQSEGTTASTRTIRRHLNAKGLYGADTRPGSGVQDDVGASVNPLRASDPALTRTRRIRSHKEKREEAELRRYHALASPPTRSSSRAPTIPRYEAPALRPAEHHVEVILCCEICGACFPTETDLESHQAEHLHETLHECEECGKAFQSAAGLKTHKKRKHGC